MRKEDAERDYAAVRSSIDEMDRTLTGLINMAAKAVQDQSQEDAEAMKRLFARSFLLGFGEDPDADKFKGCDIWDAMVNCVLDRRLFLTEKYKDHFSFPAAPALRRPEGTQQ